MRCYECNHEMIYICNKEKTTFNGKDYEYQDEYYKCPECGIISSLDNHENAINSFVNRRIKSDNKLLQSDDITRRRIACGFGTHEFWYSFLQAYFPRYCDYWFIEGGEVQTKEQDDAIQRALESIEADVKGKRVFPLRMYGYDFYNDFEPKRFYWVVEMLCLKHPTSESELYKKLIYFDSKYNYTHAKYTTDNGEYYVANGNCFLDYMVNVQHTLKIETKNNIDYYVSSNEPEYPEFEKYIDSYYYDKDKKSRMECLNMLRNIEKVKLKNKDIFTNGQLEAHRFWFQDIEK